LVETKRLIAIGGVIAVIAIAAFIGSRGGIRSTLSDIPEYKILSINKNVTTLYDDEATLWENWISGQIGATEFASKSQFRVDQLTRFLVEIDPEKVPEEWKQAYDYYRSYVSILRDSFVKSQEYALAKERNNLTDDQDYYMQQQISGMVQQASDTLQASMSSWPVPRRGSLMPSFQGLT